MSPKIGTNSWLERLGKNAAFQKVISLPLRDRRERYDGELLLRFLSLRRATPDMLAAARDATEFLNTQARNLAKDITLEQNVEDTIFKRTFFLLESALSGKALHSEVQGADETSLEFDLALYDATTIGLASNLDRFDDAPVERVEAGIEHCRAATLRGQSVQHSVETGRRLFANV